MKYLAIKNWDTFQPARRSAEWIKDYTNQSDDEDLGSLSFFEQGVLQALRRARGRSGKNIHNDFAHIASATHARVTDRPHLRHALDTLITRGLLIPTNEQHDSLEESREDKKRGEKKGISTIFPVSADAEKTKTNGDFTPDDLVFMVLRELHIPATNPELTVTVAAAIQAKGNEPGWTLEKAAEFFIERGNAYKQSDVWNTEFKSGWLKWFGNQRYDQDPKAWTRRSSNRGYVERKKKPPSDE